MRERLYDTVYYGGRVNIDGEDGVQEATQELSL